MDLFGISTAKTRQVDATTKPNPKQPSKMMALIKGLKHIATRDNLTAQTFEESEYDLSEISRAMDVESLVAASFDKHVTMCLKEGYEICCKDNEIAAYLRMRIRYIEMATGISWDETVRDITQNTVRYCNAFLVKVRSADTPDATPTESTRGRTINPVIGLFSIDPQTMRAKRDKRGKILQWQQYVNGLTADFRPEDIVHFYHNRRTGTVFGVPWIIPALDDIRLLRRLEENIDLLMVQHLFPLYHYAIGSDQQPAEGSEIENVQAKVEAMPTEGAIVTDHRHKIEAIGAEAKAINADKYLEHFYMRVLGGLNLSKMDLGDGSSANRSTGEVMNRVRQEKCKDFQIQIATIINLKIINELLQEGGYPIFDEAGNPVAIWKFKEIDLDYQIKKQNQAVYLYEHHAITEDQTRQMMGMDMVDTDEERSKMFLNVVEIPKLQAAAEAKAVAAPNPSTGAKGNASAKAAGATKHPTRSRKDLLENVYEYMAKNMIDSCFGILSIELIEYIEDSAIKANKSLDELEFKLTCEMTLRDLLQKIACVHGFNDAIEPKLTPIFANMQISLYNILRPLNKDQYISGVQGVVEQYKTLVYSAYDECYRSRNDH